MWLTGCWVDGYGPQVFDSGISDADVVFRGCECCCEWIGHAEVCFPLSSGFVLTHANESSSIVLWVSQNIEDDYTYNLTL